VTEDAEVAKLGSLELVKATTLARDDEVVGFEYMMFEFDVYVLPCGFFVELNINVEELVVSLNIENLFCLLGLIK